MQRPKISGPDFASAEATRKRIDNLTKPLGSLGAIERLAIRLAGIAPLPIHGYKHRTVLIGAADHGVTVEGISAYPAEVTPQMVGAFLGGFAAINAFARSADATVYVADFGVNADLPQSPALLSLPVCRGTANLAQESAMTIDQFEQALSAGKTAIEEICTRGPLDIIALGEMGIGNTTSAAAIISSLTGAAVSDSVGRGTGIDDNRFLRKQQIIRNAVERAADLPLEAKIAALGGFEIVGLAGAILTCAELRLPILLDGMIVAAAAVIAAILVPNSSTMMIAAHQSVEPAHRHALQFLGLQALFDFELRLGEATGATLAFGLCDAAARMVGEMHTFAEAGVAIAEEVPA